MNKNEEETSRFFCALVFLCFSVLVGWCASHMVLFKPSLRATIGAWQSVGVLLRVVYCRRLRTDWDCRVVPPRNDVLVDRIATLSLFAMTFLPYRILNPFPCHTGCDDRSVSKYRQSRMIASKKIQKALPCLAFDTILSLSLKNHSV